MRELFLKLSLEWSMDELTDGTKDSTNPKNPSYTSSNYSSLELYFKENSNQNLDYGHKAKQQAGWLMHAD
jgi:hypothetical protein